MRPFSVSRETLERCADIWYKVGTTSAFYISYGQGVSAHVKAASFSQAHFRNDRMCCAKAVAAEDIFEGRGQTNSRGPLNRRGPLWEPRGPYFSGLPAFHHRYILVGQTNFGVGKPICEGP